MHWDRHAWVTDNQPLACLQHKFPQVACQLRCSVVSEHQAMLGADFCAIFGYPITEVMP